MGKQLIILIILAFVCMPAHSSNRYNAVLRHYQTQDKDSLKLKAAKFIINNMAGHCSPEGKGIDTFIELTNTIDHSKGIKELLTAWNEAGGNANTRMIQDSCIISDKEMIEDIDHAFNSWKSSPWHKEVGFEHFCRFILPYRVKDEHLCRGWRKVLRTKYLPVIENALTMKEAFELITDTIIRTIKQSNPYCPYTLDVLSTNRIKRADCDQRCVYTVAVLRSLGIPAVIDVVPMWGNYSQRGHSWVAMIADNGGTYTIYDKEKQAKLFNKIDASQFSNTYKIMPDDNCPYDVITEKKISKIYRIGFEHQHKSTANLPKLLADPFATDVTSAYGYDKQATVYVEEDSVDVFLCVFLTGRNWTPITMQKTKQGKAVFESLGHGVVYLPAIKKAGRLQAVSTPFLLTEDGEKRYFNGNKGNKEKVVLSRKYPLGSYITDLWGNMKGGVFEGSNTNDFSKCVQLSEIKTMPHGETIIEIPDFGMFQYVRYKASEHSRMPLTELHFFTSDSLSGYKEVCGKPIFHNVDSNKATMAFDGDVETRASALKPGYWLGCDFGKRNKQRISRIVFAPSSDNNNIMAGHLYELYYFDTDWHLIKRVMADCGKLTFYNVPKGALLLLKDRTIGVEERIFEYREGKQIWY